MNNNMKPIIFNTDMVKATIEGRKTQARCIVKPQPDYTYGRSMGKNHGAGPHECRMADGTRHEIYSPFGQAGDMLYVRETWAISAFMEYLYKANGDERIQPSIKWKPSIHMPKEAARLFLQITDMRIERLQDISESDAVAEGVEWMKGKKPPKGFQGLTSSIEIEGYRAYGRKNEWMEDNKKIISRYAHNGTCISSIASFKSLWQDINDKRATWESNPWVWAITFKINHIIK